MRLFEIMYQRTHLFLVLFIWLFFFSCRSSGGVDERLMQPVPDFEFDESKALERLSRSLQFATVSLEDTTQIDYEIYDDFIDFLEVNFPAIHKHLEKSRIGGYSLLYTWEGNRPDLKPVLLMGHYDVVPVADDAVEFWQYPPFSGAIEDGFVWGRGALDDKGGIISVMEAVEHLAASGFRPERTIYIALHHDEEVGGLRGAARISKYLRDRGVELEFLVDEGSPIAEEIIENMDVPLAMIGVAEKGSVNIELVMRQEGGHSSMPPRGSVISVLSNAVNRIERRPMKAHYRGLIVETFQPVIPYMTFTQRLAFNNAWLFRPFIKRELGKNPATNAALRTTAAKTVFEAGFKENVLPVEGRVIINFRVHPNDTIEDVESYVRQRIRNPNIQVRVMERARNPSPVSSTRARPYGVLKQTIESTFETALVAPSLFVAASDSRHFLDLTPNIYRFRPIRATHDDRARIHGIDERIRAYNYVEMVQFQIRLIRKSSSDL